METIDNFFIKEHSILIKNLNKISDDLLKAKWYFLATISAIGLAYSHIFKEKWSIYGDIFDFINSYLDINIIAHQTTSDNNGNIFLICIIGNIIFWLINEYALSMGFLFRYIQSKAAKKEKYFEAMNYNGKAELNINKLIKDPTDKLMFFDEDNNTIIADFFIPDQFIPLYWASIWAIVINSIFAIYMTNNSFCQICAIIIIGLILIFKIISYHIMKIRRFVHVHCKFDVFISCNKKHNPFYQIPSFSDYLSYGFLFTIQFILITFFIIFMLRSLYNIAIPVFSIWQSFSLISIIFIFWFPIFALIIHIIRFLFQFIDFYKNPPKYSGDEEIYIDVDYKVFWKFHWYYWLLNRIL